MYNHLILSFMSFMDETIEKVCTIVELDGHNQIGTLL